jgi:dienelactone hydrolase
MSPRIVFDAPTALTDQPLSLRVVEVQPGCRLTLRASCVDSSDITYSSWAEFEAGANQIVDPSKQSPLAGTYQGVDPFGLWWSMVSVPERLFPRNLRPVPTFISAEIAGKRVAQTELTRLRIAPEVRVESVRSGALIATLFFPDALARAPGVMVLGGSEGGLSLAEEHAALLASHGFAALAVSYFAVAGLPPRLVQIPLEYAESAAQWLLRQPRVSGPGIGVVATSRGVELALLLASVFPRVCAVVGFAGSSVMWQGFTSGLHPRAAWTRRGKDLPFAIPQPQPPLPASKGPLVCRPWFVAALPKQRNQADAMIPLERIRGAVLLVSGGDDQLWPSRLLAQCAMRRLAVSQADHRARGHVHLTYSRAGHGVVPMPGLPAPPTVLVGRGGISYDLGGSKSGNARSAQHAWPRVLSFLSEHLEGSAAAPSRRRHRCA